MNKRTERDSEIPPTSIVVIFALTQVVTKLAKYSALVLAVYFGVYRPVQIIGVGFVQVLISFKLEIIIPWASAAFFFVLWQVERRTGARAIHREHRRVEELETRIDPNRTSSGLKE